jgi:hypothetical protein
MPRGRSSEDSGGDTPPRLSFGQRLLLALPRFKRDRDDAPLLQRLRKAIVKPGPAVATPPRASDAPRSVEELEEAVKTADDKERTLGLIAAPLAAAIGILIISALISNDPSALLKDGAANPRHVSVSLYHNLTVVLLGMSVLILATAMLRKRLFLGMVMALYGLAIFNLHYWGFGVPFLMGGSWLLVRAYRLQRSLTEATGGRQGGGASSRMSRPRPNKRYTPPT